VQDGRLSRDEVAHHPQRSVITRAVGVEQNVEVDTLAPLVLQPGDQILLCSDGLTGPVTDEEIAHLLTTEPDGAAVVDQLIQAANDAGGPDNITVVLLRVEDDGSPLPIAPGDTDDAADIDASDQATGAIEVTPPPKSIPIRTRPESEHHDWAADMSRYGDRQGVDSGTGLDNRSTGRRILGVATGVIVLLAVLAGGGYLILSRAYFIGPTEAETVGIFRGLNGSVAGIELYSEVSDSGVPVSSLPEFQQARINEGITVGDVEEAEATVEGYREDLEDAEAEGGAGGRAGRATDAPTPAP
jgi:PPM family protein phosphatase